MANEFKRRYRYIFVDFSSLMDKHSLLSLIITEKLPSALSLYSTISSDVTVTTFEVTEVSFNL